MRLTEVPQQRVCRILLHMHLRAGVLVHFFHWVNDLKVEARQVVVFIFRLLLSALVAVVEATLSAAKELLNAIF